MFMFIRISDPVLLRFTLFDCNERTDYLSRMYFSVSSGKRSIMDFRSKKQTGNLLMCQEKHTGSKVAACYSCNVAIRSNNLELLDVVWNFIKKDSSTGLSCGFEKFLRKFFNKTVPGDQVCLLDLEQIKQRNRRQKHTLRGVLLKAL